jgi:hypothetical protein
VEYRNVLWLRILLSSSFEVFTRLFQYRPFFFGERVETQSRNFIEDTINIGFGISGCIGFDVLPGRDDGIMSRNNAKIRAFPSNSPARPSNNALPPVPLNREIDNTSY